MKNVRGNSQLTERKDSNVESEYELRRRRRNNEIRVDVYNNYATPKRPVNSYQTIRSHNTESHNKNQISNTTHKANMR
jgi:hypothetical protein